MRKILLDKDLLYKLYVEEKKSLREIAKILKVSFQTVLQRLKEYGIPVRNRNEARIGKHYPKISEALKGKYPSKETRKKLSEALKGITRSEETRKKMSEAKKGSSAPTWKGGIMPENKLIRDSIELRLWREAVFARDNWTCQACGQRGGKLVVHHINNFAEYPELRTSIENGITLCKDCHKAFHKRYGFTNNTKEQLEEFLRST